MEKNNFKAWLYLLPAILFLGVFMVYPLVDVLIYSFEEGFNSASQSFFGKYFKQRVGVSPSRYKVWDGRTEDVIVADSAFPDPTLENIDNN